MTTIYTLGCNHFQHRCAINNNLATSKAQSLTTHINTFDHSNLIVGQITSEDLIHATP